MEYNILIVNDQEVDYKLISSYLKLSEGNYQIHKAINGAIACTLASELNPDLIIMDWDMPVMDGIEAIRKIKRTEATKDIPIIMLTAVNRSSESLKTAFKAGAMDFVRHPVDKTEFLARIKSVLLLSEYYKEKVSAEQKAKQLLKENVDIKNIELATLALKDLNTKKLLLKLKKEVKRIKPNCPEVSGLQTMLKSLDNRDKDWKIFEDYFKMVYNGFFTRLKNVSSELSQAERKFCAFNKIGLTSEEISKLQNISKEGIKKRRYLLRKKFKLSTPESLDDYIANI